MTHCYLRIGSDALEEAEAADSIAEAKDAYLCVAEDLARFGQQIDATIHIANNLEDVADYPDYHLSLGPRGGLRCERC